MHDELIMVLIFYNIIFCLHNLSLHASVCSLLWMIEESDTNNNIMRPKNKNVHVTRDPSHTITNS